MRFLTSALRHPHRDRRTAAGATRRTARVAEATRPVFFRGFFHSVSAFRSRPSRPHRRRHRRRRHHHLHHPCPHRTRRAAWRTRELFLVLSSSFVACAEPFALSLVLPLSLAASAEPFVLSLVLPASAVPFALSLVLTFSLAFASSAELCALSLVLSFSFACVASAESVACSLALSFSLVVFVEAFALALALAFPLSLAFLVFFCAPRGRSVRFGAERGYRERNNGVDVFCRFYSGRRWK